MIGFFATLISNVKIKLFGSATTNGVKVEGFVEDIFEADEFTHFGFTSKGIKGTTHIIKCLSDNKRNIISVASKNYDIEILIDDGETKIWSTDASGVLKSVIHLTKDGKIKLNGESEAIVLGNALLTKMNAILTVLKTHTHTNGNAGSPTGAPIQTINSLDDSILSTKNFGA